MVTNRQLLRQLKKSKIKDFNNVSKEQFEKFINLVEQSYNENDKYAYRLERMLELNEIELKEFNEKLQKKIKQIKQELEQKQTYLIHQSRLAILGEMISMLAHHWRQPLSVISTISSSLSLKANFGEIDKDLMLNSLEKINKFTNNLSQTIENFRKFYKPDKEKEKTNFNLLVKEVLGIIKVPLENKNIQLIKELNCSRDFNTYTNEIKQVILNLVKNAEEVLVKNNIKNGIIKIKTYEENNFLVLEVIDNGGGVPEKIIDKIFDPYFSTKHKKNGTGLGLYMSKMIVEDHCKGLKM